MLVPVIGIEVKGAKRWLDFYLFRFQPIELIKPFFVLITVRVFSIIKIKKILITHIFLVFYYLLSVLFF